MQSCYKSNESRRAVGASGGWIEALAEITVTFLVSTYRAELAVPHQNDANSPQRH